MLLVVDGITISDPARACREIRTSCTTGRTSCVRTVFERASGYFPSENCRDCRPNCSKTQKGLQFCRPNFKKDPIRSANPPFEDEIPNSEEEITLPWIKNCRPNFLKTQKGLQFCRPNFKKHTIRAASSYSSACVGVEFLSKFDPNCSK